MCEECYECVISVSECVISVSECIIICVMSVL